MKACCNPEGGHEPCLCEGVAGLRPATPSHKHGQYCFCHHPVVLFAVVSHQNRFGKLVLDENVLG